MLLQKHDSSALIIHEHNIVQVFVLDVAVGHTHYMNFDFVVNFIL